MPEADPRQVNLGYALSLAPEKAIEYFQTKGFKITWNWWEDWQEAHDKAFTVAKMARFDLLAKTRRIVDRKLRQGLTVRQASLEMESELRKAGWWGRQVVVDKQGRAERIQLGSAHRIRTILRTNALTAYAAGRWKSQSQTTGDFPYWKYVAVRDRRTRRSHAALNGRIFPADSPVWESIYPPNGFNCRCKVRSLSARQVKAQGVKVVEKTRLADVTQEVGVDKRTGEVITRPGKQVLWREGNKRRHFTPDPGWSYNPGREGLWRAPDEAAKAVSGQPDWRLYGLPHARDLAKAPEPEQLSPAKTPAEARQTVATALGLSARAPRRRVATPDEEVLLDLKKTEHVTAKFDQHRERYANRILPTLIEPNEIWMTYYNDGTFRKRYLKVFEGRGGKGRGALSVVVETPDGQLFYNFIPTGPTGINQNRTGVLLYEDKGR